jgi:hypothetical protein
MHVIKKCAYLLWIQELAKPDKMQPAAHIKLKRNAFTLERILWFTAIAPLVLICEVKIKFHAAPGLNGACGDASHSFPGAFMCIWARMLNGLPNTYSACEPVWSFSLKFALKIMRPSVFLCMCALGPIHPPGPTYLLCSELYASRARAALLHANSDRKRRLCTGEWHVQSDHKILFTLINPVWPYYSPASLAPFVTILLPAV